MLKGSAMLLSFALFESLDERGRIDSFFIFPIDGGPVIGDLLTDVRSTPRSHDVDLGPLRLYTDEARLRVRRTVTDLSAGIFSESFNQIKLDLAHGPLAVSEHTGGFYSLLLPRDYFGQVEVSEKHDIHWLKDEERLLISVKLYRPWQAPPVHLSIKALLRQNELPQSDISQIKSTDVYADWDSGPHHNSVRGFVRAANASLSQHAPSAFLCHASADKEFVRRLAIALASEGINVWIDEGEILVGDSLLDKIEEGIMESKYLVVVLSENSVNSRWCREELKMAMFRQTQERGIKVLPILIDDSIVPGVLQ
ncbi:MAG TPA: toll/interleukin-1 receptor domain-containing protein, partial [Planctomycetaceae bacterium]|nr:toll/interleukin-1 receptor domain-containing protein [Planctomycetaceae bacterium]